MTPPTEAPTAADEVFVALPWINVFARDEVEGAQRMALLAHIINALPWADYADAELLRWDGPEEGAVEWSPPDTVEAATDRFRPYLGLTWLRSATAYGPAPHPYFVVRRYEPNPEALRRERPITGITDRSTT